MSDIPVVRPRGPAPRESAPSGLRTYLHTLYEHCLTGEDLDDDVEIEVRPIKGGRPLHAYRGAKDLAGAIKLVRGAADSHADVYNGVHLRHRGTERGGDAAVAVLTAIICDIDCEKGGISRQAAINAVNASPFGAPTMVVWSGGGIHGYWVYNERVDADPDAIKLHRLGCAYMRAWLQNELGRGLSPEAAKRIADDMSTPDRILRSPGTFNMKPARAAANGGQPPPVEIVAVNESQWIDIADIQDKVPPGFNPDAYAGRISRARTSGDVTTMPTTVPERIRRVLAHANIPFRIAKSGEYISALKLLPCPACGQSDGGCYITPKTGTLRTYHSSSCPAASTAAGIPLDEWVYRYARVAVPSLDAPAPPSPVQLERSTRLSLALGSFLELPPPSITSMICEPGLSGVVYLEGPFVSASQVAGMPTRGQASLPVQLAKLAAPEGSIFATLRDANGDVRQAAILPSEKMLPPRLAFSKGDDVVAGGVLTMGHLPDAADHAAGGATLYIAHSALDYVAVLGLATEMGGQWAALGILSDAARVFGHLADRWTEAGVRPKRVVVFKGRSYSDAAVKRLDGVAGTTVIDVPPEGVNAAIKAGLSPEGLKRRIRSEPARYRAPAHILDSGVHIAADIRSAVTFAANTSTEDRQTLVIYVIPPGGGKTTAAQLIASEVATGALVVPVVGKRPNGVPAHQWPPQGRAVGFALPNHALADEKHRDHIEHGIAAHPDRFQSALRDCKFADRVRPAYRFVGRRGICGDKGKPNRCEHADNGCPGAVAPSAQRGAVAYVAHAMARYLKLDFAFIDEDVGVIETNDATDEDVRTLFMGYGLPRVKRWRDVDNAEAPICASLLNELFAPLAHSHGVDVASSRVAPYARRIGGDELCRLIETKPKVVQLLEIAFGKDAAKPPQPRPEELRAGSDIHKHMPHGGAWSALVQLRAMFRRLRPTEDEAKAARDAVALPIFIGPKSPQPMVDLVLHESGHWSLAVRTIKDLPKCPVVLLDATGELTLAEYQAAYPQFRVVMRGLQLWGTAPKPAIHVRTKGVGRTAIFLRSGHMRPHAPTAVRNIVRHLVTEVRKQRPAPRERRLSIGMLTYKGIYDYIVGAVRGGGVLATLRAELAADGVDLRVGYFGRDDRGTNAFERVDGLAVVGDARQNLGEVEADCTLLGLESSDVFSARADAVLVQAIFRARHTRRTPGNEAVILLASAARPHIPGIAWREESMPRGTVTSEAFDVAAFVAAELGVVGDEPIRSFSWALYDQVPPKMSHRAMQESVAAVIALNEDWQPYSVTLAHAGDGAPCLVWATDEGAARAWAMDVAGSRRVEPGHAAAV